MAIDFSTFFRHNIKEQGGKVSLPGARSTPFGARGRQGAAAGCALYALRGRAAAGTGRHWLVSMTVYAAHNKRGFAPRTNVRALLAAASNEER